jgi:hypothetical protein
MLFRKWIWFQQASWKVWSEIFTHSLKLNKSLLSESLRDSVEDNIACDTEKRTKQENRALKSQIDKCLMDILHFNQKQIFVAK